MNVHPVPFSRYSTAVHVTSAQRRRALLARATLTGWLLLAGSTLAAAQVCFEPGVTALPASNAGPMTTADIDGDHDLDLVLVTANQVYISRNQGNGTFAPRELVYQSPDSLNPRSFVAADFDGDADVDLAVFRTGNPGGGGITAGILQLVRNDGTGAFTNGPGTSAFTDPGGIVGADFDGDSDMDVLVTHLIGFQTIYWLRNGGTGGFTISDSTLPVNAAPGFAVLGDIDGDSDVDIVSARAGGLFTLQNDGSGQFSVLGTYPPTAPALLADLDGDGDLDLVSIQTTTTNVLAVSLNSGNGTFSAATIIPGFSGAFFSVGEVASGDVDGDGDVDLVVAAGTAPRLTVLRNMGNATFDILGDLATEGSNFLRGANIADLDGDGDVELLSIAYAPSGGVRQYRGCRTAGEPICLGDGTGAACPCANHSAPGAQAGCLNSFGTAGTLRGEGSARIASDTLVLNGTGMTNAAVLYFQGTTAMGGGSGAAFGDGLRCAGGSVNRLGLRTNSGGASSFPGLASPSISVLGNVTTPGERIYQAWYRNTASFCAPEGFNLTNGLRVLWTP